MLEEKIWFNSLLMTEIINYTKDTVMLFLMLFVLYIAIFVIVYLFLEGFCDKGEK